MPVVDVYDIEKKKVGELNLAPEIFTTDVKEHLFYEVVKMQLANRRQGNAATKTRGQVSGGGKKPWRQKGTGRARIGSSRSPIWRGGGTVFGPHPRSYAYQVPKKVRKAALRSALSLKLKDQQLTILNELTLPEIKTKQFAKVMSNLDLNKVLFVIPEKNEIVEKSARNIPAVKILRAEGLNVFDLLKYPQLVLTTAAVAKIEGALKP